MPRVVHAPNEQGKALCRFLPGALVAREGDGLEVTCEHCRVKLGTSTRHGLVATQGMTRWPIVRLNTGWCFAKAALAEESNCYDPDDPCPGPHGELYAAKS
jgi:hypothetical protein